MKKYGRTWRDVCAGELDNGDPQFLLDIGEDGVWLMDDASALILVSDYKVYISEI